MNFQNSRNPRIPHDWVRQVDSTTGQPTHIYRGPWSTNHISQAYTIDRGPEFPLEVEYFHPPLPELGYHDELAVIEERFDFTTEVNTYTVFGDPGEQMGAAA